MRPIETQITLYLEWCQYVKRMTPSTILTKRQALERFVRFAKVDDFTQLTNWQFDEWRVKLARDGKTGKTINNYSEHVACCVKWLKTHRKMEVALDFDIIERAEEEETEIVIYTDEEISRALQTCKGPREDVLLSLAYQSGLRLNEITTLRVENIDGRSIQVRGKGRKRRRTFVREDTQEKLNRWLLISGISDGWVFPSTIKWGDHLTPQEVRNGLSAPFERAGIPKRVHPHAIRHSWFTKMLDSGAPLMDTAIMGGHSDPRTTKRYYHASPKRHAELHERFIPKMDELTAARPVDNRPQELL